MNPGFGNTPPTPEPKRDAVEGRVAGGGDEMDDDPFVAIFDRALEVAEALVSEFLNHPL